MSALHVIGVGRMFDNERAVLVMLDRKPTDDELRSVHEHMRSLPGSAPSNDLVPLKNGRSVDLGGRWTMPT